MVRIISWNVNGLRSNIVSDNKWTAKTSYLDITKSNLGQLISTYNPDIICLQEIKCNSQIGEQLLSSIQNEYPYRYWNESKGEGRRGSSYSGTAVLSKLQPINVIYQVDEFKDISSRNEGRFIQCNFDSFTLINVYTPNSGSNANNRILWDKAMCSYLYKLNNVVFTGDMNVCRGPIDIYRGDETRSSYDKRLMINKDVPGYLEVEQTGIERILNLGYIDTFRYFEPTLRAYTWFNARIPNSKAHNLGWRLDYFIVSPSLIHNITLTGMLYDMGDFNDKPASDHIPILLDLNM